MITTLNTDDGEQLEAEWAYADDPRAVVVLCHPHPNRGGTMRSIVTSAQFDALPRQGFSCLRFNFRGVEGSTGTYTGGENERRDVLAAIAAAAEPGLPIVLSGWSFGADIALGIADSRVRGWVAIAPPLRFLPAAEFDTVAHDERAKLLILAAQDEFRAPAEIEQETHDWINTRVDIVAGASHFFVGRTDRAVELTAAFAADCR
ncbi:MAG TPA: hypothetical protein VFR41_11830 [Acidimicrobiia bacterium]|nr:hypothetical protein [Acidimicrobiia bacterium]